ncbi:MAG: DUF1553 domain-containing protein [Planctomycetota bacterium]
MIDRTIRNRPRLGVLAALASLAALPAVAAPAGDRLEYNRDIRPILAEQCFACHGPDSASREAGLRLDVREEAIDMAAIVPGDADASEIINRVLTDDPDLVMPPPETKRSLTDEQRETLRRWVAQGAEYQPHWSFIPIERPSTPEAGGWAKNAIDGFIYQRLKESRLAPAQEASPTTLLRRLALDITGLPPKPEQIDEFVANYRERGDAAVSDWIDRLMATTAWGEHRGRYWLDAARYGDTHGLHFDNYREMWPYRDWVIRSFNANQPFDQFTVEQLAGDLLPDPTTDQLVATGLQRCNITTNEGGTIKEENLANYAADHVQTFGWVYLGLTTNCAQCHDHKFDPITMRDYYALAAFFRNTESPALDGNSKDGKGPVLRIPTAEDKTRLETLPAEIKAARSELKTMEKQAAERFAAWRENPEPLAEPASTPPTLHAPLAGGLSEGFKATGELKWSDDGRAGPAAVLSRGHTIDLGGGGDLDFDDAFTIAAWLRPASGIKTASPVARMDVGGGYRGWDLWQNRKKLGVHLIDTWPSNAIKMVTRKDVAPPGKWTHVVATYDGSRKPQGVKMYVNGEPVELKVDNGSIKPNATMRTDTPLRVGQRSTNQHYAGGSVQELRIYDRVLSRAELVALPGYADAAKLLAVAAEGKKVEDQEPGEHLLRYFASTGEPLFGDRLIALDKLQREEQKILARSPMTHIQRERKNRMASTPILMRGAYDRPGEEVPAGTPLELHPFPEDAPRNRLGLAQWVVDRQNPLTARVTVNRFWSQVFGRGLVETVEDLGVSGDLPSHPELLDWLAAEFIESGWDVKHLFKLMLSSATYRQAAISTPEKREADPQNVLLAHGPRFRMDAEMIRDSALAASGLLSPKMYGPGVRPYQPTNLWEVVGLPGGDTRRYKQDKGESLYRRSLYTFWKRMAPPPSLETFGAPAREVCTVRRERTNTPLQALVTLNDTQYVEAARRLAESTLKSAAEAGDDGQADRLQRVARRVINRDWTEQETPLLVASLNQYRAAFDADPAAAERLIAVGESAFEKSLDPAELAAWTLLCNHVLNLDETLNK